MQVVGIFRGKTKDKNDDYTVIHVIGDFEDYQQENAIGNKAESHYVKGYVDVNLGDEIELVYGIGYQGKAIVKGISVLV